MKLETKILQYISYSALALFVYMPFHVFLSVWLSTYTGGLDYWKIWKDVFTALVTILCVATVFIYSMSTKLYRRVLYLIAGYAFVHVILFFTTNQPELTGTLGLVYNLRIFCYLIIGFSLALLFPKIKLQSYYFKILIAISSFVCIIAIAQFLLPKDIMVNFGYAVERGVKPNFFIDDKPDLFRAFSTLRDPNSLGAFLILPITFLAHKFMKYFKSEKRVLFGGLLLLHVWVLLLTFSRSTLLATVLSVGVLLMLQNIDFIKRHKNTITAYSLIFLTILVGVIYILRDQYFVQNIVFHADESTTLDSPNELRAFLAQNAVDGIVDEPFGYGPGTAGLVSIRSGEGLLTENYYLQILFEVGVFGFIFFVAILYIIARQLWSKRKKDYAKVMLASFTGLLFASLFFHTLSNEAVSISFFLLAGLMLRVKD